MKSEKAKEYLKLTATNPDSPFAQDQDYVWVNTSVIGAIELAEQEAEERVHNKTVEAFKETCFHRDKDWCSISMMPTEDGEYDSGKCCNEYCKDCYALKKFIQKLNENEND